MSRRLFERRPMKLLFALFGATMLVLFHTLDMGAVGISIKDTGAGYAWAESPWLYFLCLIVLLGFTAGWTYFFITDQ